MMHAGQETDCPARFHLLRCRCLVSILGCAEQAYLRCSEERGDVAFSLYCTSAIHYGIATCKGRVNPNFGLTFASHFYSALATSIATTAVKK